MKKSPIEILGEPLSYYGLEGLPAPKAAAFLKKTKKRINASLLKQGVYLLDPETTYIGPKVRIGEGTVIYPNTHIYGETSIGKGNVIGPNCYLEECRIGDGNKIQLSHIVDTEIGNATQLGPYFRSRGGAKIEDGVKIGNFNEIKNAAIGKESRMAHLSYLGDVDVGEDVNVGAGTITANYDGASKFHSSIGDRAFIGSGSTIVSPVSIGNDAFLAAGSTITEDVPPHAMAIAREHQTNKEGYGDLLRQRAKDKKGK